MLNCRKKNELNKIIFTMISLILLFLFILFFPFKAKTIYISNYVFDGFCVLIVIICLSSYVERNGFDIFEPIYFISLIFTFMYFIAPMYDISITNYEWFGYDLFKYGIVSSLIAIVAFLSFFLVYRYSGQKKYNIKIVFDKKTESNNVCENKRISIVRVVLIMYVFCFAANVYYLVHSGYKNLLYILTLGFLGGESGSNEYLSSIGFISMFSYCLPTVTLLYWNYGKSKLLKISLFVPMLMLQVARGFRFFVVQIAVTFFAYYFIKSKKRPKSRDIVLTLIVLMIPVLIMTLFRETVRDGYGVDFSKVNLENIRKSFDAAFWDNLRIYNNFYGIVGAIPEKFDFVYGRQMIFGTMIMVIPRIIWTNKLDSRAGAGLEEIIGANLAGTGQAYPNLGEYYFAFGVVGVILFMMLYGWWMKKVKNKGMQSDSSGLDIIVFSSLLGGNLQLLIRGYTPSNFWYIIFLILPVLIIKKVFRLYE